MIKNITVTAPETIKIIDNKEIILLGTGTQKLLKMFKTDLLSLSFKCDSKPDDNPLLNITSFTYNLLITDKSLESIHIGSKHIKLDEFLQDNTKIWYCCYLQGCSLSNKMREFLKYIKTKTGYDVTIPLIEFKTNTATPDIEDIDNLIDTIHNNTNGMITKTDILINLTKIYR